MIPCKDCITLAACKHQDYLELIKKCSLLYKTLYSDKHPRYIKRKSNFNKLVDELNEVMDRDVGGIFTAKTSMPYKLLKITKKRDDK